MKQSFHPQVDRALHAAGWESRRQAPELVKQWKRALEEGGRFTLHDAAQAVLVSFGGLRLGERGPGVHMARSTVYLDPEVAIGEEDRFCDYFDRLRGREVFPLGEIDEGHAFLGIDREGRVYLLMDEVLAEWPSFEAAIDELIRGVRSTSRR